MFVPRQKNYNKKINEKKIEELLCWWISNVSNIRTSKANKKIYQQSIFNILQLITKEFIRKLVLLKFKKAFDRTKIFSMLIYKQLIIFFDIKQIFNMVKISLF